MPKNYNDEIREALRAKAAGAAFPIVRYPSRVRTVQGTTVGAKSILIGRSAAVYGESSNMRSERRERVAESWLMTLRFDTEVDLDAFEEDLLSSPPRVVRDPANGITRQVTLRLEESAYREPPRQQPSSGTKVTYRFTAAYTPR